MSVTRVTDIGLEGVQLECDANDQTLKIPAARIQILSDNVTRVCYLNHMGGPIRTLTETAANIWDFGNV